ASIDPTAAPLAGSCRQTRVAKPLVDTPAASLTPVAGTGVGRSVAVPSPNWPNQLDPQAHSVPSILMAKLSVPAALTWATPVRLVSSTGLRQPDGPPSPTCPYWLDP